MWKYPGQTAISLPGKKHDPIPLPGRAMKIMSFFPDESPWQGPACGPSKTPCLRTKNNTTHPPC